MPKPDDDMMELMVSVVVDEAVPGVMGGGDRGVVGERGHLNRELGVSGGGAKPGEDIPLRGESIDRAGVGPLYELASTNDLSFDMGPFPKLKRKPGDSGVGVVGVMRPLGGTTDGS